MPLSRNVVKASQVAKRVLEFVPPKFEMGSPEQAIAYLERKKAGDSDFRMSDAIRMQTGVEKMEASLVEENVELKVLDRLKEVQELAYQEAYQLGLDEGRKKAFQENAEQIKTRLDHMDQLFTSVQKLKTELVDQNESHLVQLAFHMAKRLAHVEVKTEPKVVMEVIRRAIELAQIEEEVVVQVSPEQIEFLESLKNETGREFEFMKSIKLVPMQGLGIGGCVIETNYGEIDARFDERVNTLWEAISENLHRVKGKVSST